MNHERKGMRPMRINECRNLLASAAVLSMVSGLCIGCSTEPPEVGSTTSALTQAECNFFDVNGKVRICHATGSAKNPYQIIQISDNGCINGHVSHQNDYIATANDPDCHGGGCFPVGAPA